MYGRHHGGRRPLLDGLPLTMLEKDAEAEVIEVRGGPGFARRLMEMGIRAGSRIVVQVHAPGHLIAQVDRTRLALSHGIAHRIVVRRRESGEGRAGTERL